MEELSTVLSIYIVKEVIWDFGRASQHVVLEQWWQIHSCLWHMNTLRKVQNQNESSLS